MSKIAVLDQITIDKIAAGEVIERPASIVKELVENAIDAGATMITVEIQDGGISLIRITDNGCGIEHEDVRNAFLRHSTSKIRKIDDLVHISSLGFRGEALSSIAAVSQVELITKVKEDTLGSRYCIEGGQEKLLEDAGAPDGTTFIIRQLFYNVPARRKFLRTPMTEASHINDLLTRLTLSHPEIGFKFINNNQTKIQTPGNGQLKDVIYNIYGREITANLQEIHFNHDQFGVHGFLGKPLISRGNRNYETYFMNGRYVKSPFLSKAIEDAYKDFMMQHKFPFVVLHFTIDGEAIDVNVHPTKMDLRFHRQQEVYNLVYEAVHETLLEPELIPKVTIDEPTKVMPHKDLLLKPKATPTVCEKHEDIMTVPDHLSKNPSIAKKEDTNENKNSNSNDFSKCESYSGNKPEVRDEAYFIKKMKERVLSYHNQSSAAEVSSQKNIFKPEIQMDRIREAAAYRANIETTNSLPLDKDKTEESTCIKKEPERQIELPQSTEIQKTEQLTLFEDKFLTKEAKAKYQLIGQVFDTYWLVQFEENLYIIDQHAAHERVLYERTLKSMKTRAFTSQYISPPIILTLSMSEAETLTNHMEQFTRIGFEIEPFGGDEFAVRAVPDNLFSIAKKELFLEMLDAMADGINTGMTPDIIDEKVASMSCKAAVKGNNKLSAVEVDALIGELLTLENPYHCPHGRPTIIAMSKRDLEKKFKRIV